MFSNLLAEPTRDNLWNLLVIYLSLAAILLFSQWYTKRSVGLPLVYAFALSIIHAIAAYIHSIPTYTPKSDILVQSGITMVTTFFGFRVTTVGFLGYVIGVLVCPILLAGTPKLKTFFPARQITSQLPGTLLIISFLSFFILTPIFRRIPSMGSMATAGAAISVVAVFMFCWQAYERHDSKRFLWGLVSTIGFPFVTIIFMGFAGYGANAAAMVWLMVIRFFKPRIVAFVVLGLALYGGLTFYVNWIKEREEIRASVWGQRSLEERLQRATALIENFQFLDTSRQLHLEIIDLRINQNHLVGKAYQQLELGRVDYAHGYTLLVAAVAWVPRILWPGKPATGGSGGVVAHFTGQKFAEGTSVGAGQPFEFYVNFGWWGVLGGFFILGLLIRYVDLRAGDYLKNGDYWSCARWVLAGVGLIQPGGLMAEVIGSFAAFSVFGYALHVMFFKQYYDIAGVNPRGHTRSQSSPSQPVRRRYS